MVIRLSSNRELTVTLQALATVLYFLFPGGQMFAEMYSARPWESPYSSLTDRLRSFSGQQAGYT